MSAEENKKVIKPFFDSIANAKPDDFRALVTDDITWWIPQSAAGRNYERLHSTRDERAQCVSPMSASGLLMMLTCFGRPLRRWALQT